MDLQTPAEWGSVEGPVTNASLHELANDLFADGTPEAVAASKIVGIMGDMVHGDELDDLVRAVIGRYSFDSPDLEHLYEAIVKSTKFNMAIQIAGQLERTGLY